MRGTGHVASDNAEELPGVTPQFLSECFATEEPAYQLIDWYAYAAVELGPSA